jgi:hypothetical protein
MPLDLARTDRHHKAQGPTPGDDRKMRLMHADVPAFLSTLSICNFGAGHEAGFERLIRTATRSGQARAQVCRDRFEIRALDNPERAHERGTKRREHVMPLPERCLEILKEAPQSGERTAVSGPTHWPGAVGHDAH